MCGRYEFKLSDSHKSETLKTQALKLGLQYKEGEIFPGDKVVIAGGTKVLTDIPSEELQKNSVMGGVVEI